MTLALNELPRLGRRAVRLLRVNPEVLQEDQISLRPGTTSDTVCTQLLGIPLPDYKVPRIINLRTGVLHLAEIRAQLGQETVNYLIGFIPELGTILNDPTDALCQRDPKSPHLFYWDENITTKGELIAALKQRQITLTEQTSTRLCSMWEDSRTYSRIINHCRGRATKREILETLVGRLGSEEYLIEHPEANILLGAHQIVLANKPAAYKTFVQTHPELAYEFSMLDLGEISLAMALEILGISNVSINQEAEAQDIEYFNQFMQYVNQYERSLPILNQCQITGEDFRMRKIKSAKLTKKDFSFVTSEREYCFGIKDLWLIRHIVLYSYLYKIVTGLKKIDQSLLLDYYEELTKEALAAGIRAPDNYVEGSNTPFQQLMEKLLEKYLNLFVAQINLPSWAFVEIKRDRAILDFNFGLRGESTSLGSGIDFRFVKSHDPQSGGFMFASSALFDRSCASQTNWERLEKVAASWRRANPNLSFAVH